jgi:DNA-binding CsgD family transcriptional regulator
MMHWQEDLLNLLLMPQEQPETIFKHIQNAALQLGFDHVAYGFQAPYPVTQPKITLLNNYPAAWKTRYAQAGYLLTDPSVARGRQCQTPMVWSDALFADNPSLWADAQDHGIRAGWAQSSLEHSGAGSLITLCRSAHALNVLELQANETAMRWLVQVAHVSLSRAIMQATPTLPTPLSCREREALQWSADGKSAQDIADIMKVSKNTVDFHLKNAVVKLQAANKTAAVARAALMGLLY